MPSRDPQLPLLFDRADALAAGLTMRQVRRRADTRWDRLQRGVYTAATLEADQRWRAEVLAVVRAHERPLILSHASAARAWGLPAPRAGWGTTTFTTTTGRPRRRAGGLVLVSTLPDDEIAVMGRVQVTTVARTVVDCARRLPPQDALAITDAALKAHNVTAAELRTAMRRQRDWPGCVHARRVLELADGRRESALESWSAWAFAVAGLPAPQWQVSLIDAEGVFLGRADAWWEGAGLVGEADGALKYRLAAAERGGALADGLVAVADDERRRERGLRLAGAALVRWGAVDVLEPARLRRLADVLRTHQGEASRFTGRAVLL